MELEHAADFLAVSSHEVLITALSKRPEAEALDKIRYESITDPDKIEARSVGTAPR